MIVDYIMQLIIDAECVIVNSIINEKNNDLILCFLVTGYGDHFFDGLLRAQLRTDKDTQIEPFTRGLISYYPNDSGDEDAVLVVTELKILEKIEPDLEPAF